MSVNVQRELAYTGASLGVVLAATGCFLATVPWPGSPAELAETAAFTTTVILLLWGNVVYHLARVGYLQRLDAVASAPADAGGETSALSVLIPSYKEEPGVLLQTLLSAALLDYPRRTVVVLLDDPPHASGADLAALQESRALVRAANDAFGRRAAVLRDERDAFAQRAAAGAIDADAEQARLARLHEDVADFIESWRDRVAPDACASHTDTWFVEQILHAPARAHRARAAEWRAGPRGEDAVRAEYAALAGRLAVAVTSFERKAYVNLSHAANKAMNLNSYIGLMGGRYREEPRADGLHLVPAADADATLAIPAADYLLTLDADSVVLADYARRLVGLMDGDARIAVAQTPYSAFPDAPGLLERVAGATTDIQYLVHQGFDRFAATYWVGANAVLRHKALVDIRTTATERGFDVPVFIQDRTVIEDTGSTVDLIRKGWRLHNHPERLAYSATPPDFGALLIQRRRWSNGGLIILPDLLRHLRGCGPRALPEALMRCHYLCSPAVGGFGLLFLLLYPFDDRLANLWLPLSAAPYYLLYGRDLRLAGYRWSDLLRVYALNLLLIPVTLAGVLRSLQQAATGRKSAFGRTPKVGRRTVTPPLHILLQWMLPAYVAVQIVLDLGTGNYAHAAFAAATELFLLYGLTQFIGWRDGYADLRDGLLERFGDWMAVPAPETPAAGLGHAEIGLVAEPARAPGRAGS